MASTPVLARCLPRAILGTVAFPFVFFVILVVIIVAVAGGRRYLSNVAAAWSAAAATLGLAFDRPRFGRSRISGEFDDMDVAVDVRVRRSGDSSQTFTRYRIGFPSPGFDFRLTRQTGLSRITQLFGAQDVEVGDASFDDAFVVKTDDEGRLLTLLDGGVRGALLRAAAAYPGVVFEHHQVLYERRGLETSQEVIVSTVRRLADAAAAIRGHRSFTRGTEIVSARERGDLSTLADDLGEEDDPARTLDERLLELDTLATAGHRERARRRVRSLEREIPADPELSGWRDRLEAPGEDVTPAGSEPEARAFAEEVFSGNALSFESQRTFEEKYRGSSVRWRARVKSVDPIRRHSDLGAEGGTKLVATVATIDHDLYGNTDIDAVVALPAGAGAGLDRSREVTIAGTLTRIDPLVRNVFLSDGTLE